MLVEAMLVLPAFVPSVAVQSVKVPLNVVARPAAPRISASPALSLSDAEEEAKRKWLEKSTLDTKTWGATATAPPAMPAPVPPSPSPITGTSESAAQAAMLANADAAPEASGAPDVAESTDMSEDAAKAAWLAKVDAPTWSAPPPATTPAPLPTPAPPLPAVAPTVAAPTAAAPVAKAAELVNADAPAAVAPAAASTPGGPAPAASDASVAAATAEATLRAAKEARDFANFCVERANDLAQVAKQQVEFSDLALASLETATTLRKAVEGTPDAAMMQDEEAKAGAHTEDDDREDKGSGGNDEDSLARRSELSQVRYVFNECAVVFQRADGARSADPIPPRLRHRHKRCCATDHVISSHDSTGVQMYRTCLAPANDSL